MVACISCDIEVRNCEDCGEDICTACIQTCSNCSTECCPECIEGNHDHVEEEEDGADNIMPPEEES